MSEMCGRDDARRRRTKVATGVFLMIVGGLLLAGALGVDLAVSVWRLWPFLLLGLGAVRLIWGGREEREGGMWFLLAGLYAWISVFRIGGLSWASAWPVLLVGAGLWMAAESWIRGRGQGLRGREADDVS